MKRVACLLSGGLDSALATHLLKQQRIPVTGVHLVNRLLDPQTRDIRRENAEYTSKQLDVPLDVIDLHESAWDGMIDAVATEAAQGNQPDVDTLFHKRILFGALHEHLIADRDASVVATGHWARTEAGEKYEDLTGESGITTKLLKALDLQEDESHRLSQVLQKRFQKTALPLGELNRDVMKAMLSSAPMPLLPEMVSRLNTRFDPEEAPVWKPLSKFLRPGWFVDFESGDKLQPHDGLPLFGIGQKVKVGDKNMFIATKDNTTNTMQLVADPEHPIFYCEHVLTSLAHWTRYTPYKFFMKHTMDCDFKNSTSRGASHCTLIVGMGYEYCGNDHVILSPASPVWGAESGKYLAFYSGEECIGGARTLRAGPSKYALNYHTLKPKSGQKRGLKNFFANFNVFSAA